MRIPKRPPNPEELWRDAMEDPARSRIIFQTSAESTGDRRYLHWDELRHRKPPHGLSLDGWWLALKMARAALMKTVPLRDTQDHAFQFALPDPAPELLHYIAKNAAGQMQITDQQLNNSETRDRYIVRSLMEEAITSSQLEGAATTRRVAKEMLRTKRPPRDTNEQMILNNYMAMQRIREVIDQPLSRDLLFELHRILTEDTLEDRADAGRFRRSDDVRVYDDRDNEVLHTPPPAKQLPHRIEAMCRFANEETPKYFMFPVVRAIILHFWLAYDHPFVDGNGRCARALFYWSMLRQGYWLCEFISISEIIKKAPVKYGRAFLYTETDENDLTYFILYHLKFIRRAIDQLSEYMEEKVKAVRQLERMLRASAKLNHRQLALPLT